MAELNDLSKEFLDAYGNINGANIYSELVDGAVILREDPGEFLKDSGPLDFYGAMHVLKDVLGNNASQTQGVPVYEEYNESFSKPPIIAYSLVTVEPASASKATYNETRSPKSGAYGRIMMPTHRGVYKDVREVGDIKLVVGMPRDYMVRFTCFSSSSREANMTAFAVEDTLIKFRPVIRASGIPDIMFQGMGEFVKRDVGGTEFLGRPVDFLIRVDRIFTLTVKQLLSIGIYASVRLDESGQIELDPLVTNQ